MPPYAKKNQQSKARRDKALHEQQVFLTSIATLQIERIQGITRDAMSGAANTYRSQVSSVRGYFGAGFSSLLNALGIASQDFTDITRKGGASAPSGVLDTILSVGAVIFPELTGLLLVIKEVKESKIKGISIEALGEGASILYKAATESNEENNAPASRMQETRRMAALIDNAMRLALVKLDEIENLINGFQSSNNGNLAALITAKLGEFKVPGKFQSGFDFNTSFYADVMLYELLKAYTRHHVVVEWNPLTAINFSRGPITIDSPELEKWIPIEVKGMDNADLAYQQLGTSGEFSARLRQSGRPAINGFRDLVKVWGARFVRRTTTSEKVWNSLTAPVIRAPRAGR